ncbi:hypothetical protein BRD15_05575 [Halobacteriales archaeon SW_6_65_15]|nr:MAG: hypothetical protein BRD15_05575 [Halobacteriales archaeon SW_6_65_15]
MAREETKYGHLISDDHDWNDEDDDPEDVEPAITVDSHTIRIDDQREETGYEYGLEWWFVVDAGQIEYSHRGHWLEGRTQSDPMAPPAWSEVPDPVKERLARELNTDRGALDQRVNPRLFEDSDSHE